VNELHGDVFALWHTNSRTLGLQVGKNTLICWHAQLRIDHHVWTAYVAEEMERAKAEGYFNDIDRWTTAACNRVFDSHGGRQHVRPAKKGMQRQQVVLSQPEAS
jgi:hypothetical protein